MANLVIGTDPGSNTVLLNPNLSYERNSMGLVTLRVLYFSRIAAMVIPETHQGLKLDSYNVDERGFYFATATYTGVDNANTEHEQEQSLVDGGVRILDDGEGNLSLQLTQIKRTITRTRGVSVTEPGAASNNNETASWVQRGGVYFWDNSITETEIVPAAP